MIPKAGWKTMDTAPQDGAIVIVRFREFNQPNGKVRIQPAQWLPDQDGRNWGWKKPWHLGTVAHADAWMTLEQFQSVQADEEKDSAAAEFDL